MSQPGDYQSHPSIYKINSEIPNTNGQLHREYFESYDQQIGQEQSRVLENKSEGFDGTLRLKSISIAVPSFECSSLNANLKRIKSSSLGSNSQALRTSGSSRENGSMKFQPPGIISEEDNSANGSTRQCAYSCISVQNQDYSLDIADMLPGGAIFDAQFIQDDSIKEFCVHLHFSQLMECNLYRWLSVSSSQNLSEKIKVLEIPVKKRWGHGKKNSFEAVIMKFKNGSSYSKEIGEKLDGLQKLISQFEVHKQNEKQADKQSEIEQEHLINQQNICSSGLNALTDNQKLLFDSKTLSQHHYKLGIRQKQDEIGEEKVNGEKEGETSLHKAADNPKQEFRDMIDQIIFRHRSKYFSYVLEWKDLKRCQLKKQQPSQNVQKEQSWSSSMSSSCECKSQGCYEGSSAENYSNENYPEETQMLIGHNEEFLSLVSLDRVHLSSKMIRVKKFCLFQQKISRDKYKDYLISKIDCEMRNLKEKEGLGQHCRSCLESYLELSFEGGNVECGNHNNNQQEKGVDKGRNTNKKVFKGVDMTTMDDIVFPLDISLIEEENMFFKIVFFQYDIADSNVQKVSQMRVKNQSESDHYEKNGSNSDKQISRKNNKRHSLKITKQSSISRDISMSAVGGQFEITGQSGLQGQGGVGDNQLSSSTSIHRLFEESLDSLHPKNKHYQQNSEQFISKYYPKSIMKNNSLNSSVKEDKPAVTAPPPPLPQNKDISNNSKSKLNNHVQKNDQYSQEPQQTALSHNNNYAKSEHDYEKEKELYLEEQFKLFNPQVEEDQINLQNQQAYTASNIQHMNYHSQQFTPSTIVTQDYSLQQKEQVHHYFNQLASKNIAQTHLPIPLNQQNVQQYTFPARLQQEASPLPLEAAPVPPYEQIVPKINELQNGIATLNDQEDITSKKETKKVKTPRAKKEPITPKNEKKPGKTKKLENGKEGISLGSISTILTQHEPAVASVLLPQQQQQIQTNELLKPPVATAVTSQYHTDNQLQPQQSSLVGIDPSQNQIPPQQPVFHQYPDTHSPYLLYSDQPQYSPYFQAQPGYYPQSQQQQQVPSYYPQPPPNYSPNSQQFMTVHGIPNFSAAPPGTQGYSPRIPYAQYSPYGYNNLQQASYQQPQIVQQQQYQQQQLLHQQQQQHNLNSSPTRNVISPFPQVTPQFPPLDLNAQPSLQSVQHNDQLVQQALESKELINEEVPSKKKRITKPKKAQGVGPEGDLVGLRISDQQQNQIGSSVKIDQSHLQSKNLEEQDKSPALQKKPKLNRKQSADNNNNNNNIAPQGDQVEGQQLKKKPGRPQNKKSQTKEEIKEKDTQILQTQIGDIGDTINDQNPVQSEGDSKNLEGQLTTKQIDEKQNMEQQQQKWEQYQQEQQFQQQSQHQQQQLYNEFYSNLNPFHSGDNNNVNFNPSVSPYSTPYSFGQKLPGLSGQSGAMFTAGSCQNLMSNQMIYPPEHLQNMHPQILPFSGEFPVQNPDTLQPGYSEKEHHFYQQEP